MTIRTLVPNFLNLEHLAMEFEQLAIGVLNPRWPGWVMRILGIPASVDPHDPTRPALTIPGLKERWHILADGSAVTGRINRGRDAEDSASYR